jgi:predicted nucleotidyltransferase
LYTYSYKIKDLNISNKELAMTTKDFIINTIRNHKDELTLMGIQQIGLFGSYSREEQADKSDIDILIDFAPDQETFDNYMAIYDYFENIFKNEKVDIVTMNGLSPYIGPKILKEVMYV